MPHFFITTAIDYTNAAPHIGHAYEKVLADVLARYHRLKGDDVFFLTGVDQHGQKVQQSAEKQGVAPQEFVDGLTAKFVALWDKLDISYNRPDGWAATTDARHKDCVRAILTRLNAEGHIYKAKRDGYYSVRQEQFLTDKERGEDGEFGPEWGEVVFIEEENYYFRLAEHKQWLLDLIDRRADFVTPEFRRGELRNAVEKLTGDLCISRPKSRLSWGIEFPFDPDFVTYVWFDALVNYISFAPGFDLDFNPEAKPSSAALRFKDLWPPLHVIGKDIMIPAHGVYWPIMLKAIGFTADEIPPLLVHGWWNIAGAKMSKSLGNVVDPDALADKYGAEALRYYLMSDIATGKDADFSEERLVQRYNSDLANSLGNLLNRTLSMAAKYREGALRNAPFESWGIYLPAVEKLLPGHQFYGEFQAFDLGGKVVPVGQVRNVVNGAAKTYSQVNETGHYMGSFQVQIALSAVLECATACNGLIEIAAPWQLAKDPAQAERLDAVLYHLAESLRIIAILISPVLPRAAAGIFAQLNWDKPFRLEDATWGGLPDGHVLGTPTPLFPRIEIAPLA